MGVYIKGVTIEDLLFMESIEPLVANKRVIEIPVPHGRLLDENEILKRCAIGGTTKLMDAVIEAEVK